ncbi:MAG: hypothetical protein ACR2J8_09950, partial [Thermomicrobiales bacterium]
GRLRGVPHVAEIERDAEATVRDLWARSQVKGFIGIIAMREVRAALGADRVVADPLPPRSQAFRRNDDDDVLLLSDDGLLD